MSGSLWQFVQAVWRRVTGAPGAAPLHLQRGRHGEAAARRHLTKQGLKFLAANVASKRGELDLVFRDADCLVFVEVKTRSHADWTRPAAAVDRRKQRALTHAAQDYLRRLRNPRVKFRFDIVEVLLEDEEVREIRHLPNAFPLATRGFYV